MSKQDSIIHHGTLGPSPEAAEQSRTVSYDIRTWEERREGGGEKRYVGDPNHQQPA
jgi:hypothetical protein